MDNEDMICITVIDIDPNNCYHLQDMFYIAKENLKDIFEIDFASQIPLPKNWKRYVGITCDQGECLLEICTEYMVQQGRELIEILKKEIKQTKE